MRVKETAGWTAAAELDRDFAAGIRREAIVPPPTMPRDRAPGERVLAEFSRARRAAPRYERFHGRDVEYVPGGLSVVAGSPELVGAFVVGAAAMRMRGRRKARAMSAAQWHEYDLATVVVTTHRLWCQSEGDWKNFNYDQVTRLGLDASAPPPALTLKFRAANQLRLSGEWAAWIAVAVAYGVHGLGACTLPTLAPLRAANASAVKGAAGAAVNAHGRGRR
ncbi:hypothetical protein CU254_41535 (plasmid) [Amycolatopsis sp. AA4]|uniref:hypothetical protein n=1 Tax=Actinomycetes TaxID=1760 RepID=UPI0001B556B4|nr:MULTISPECIES: hypothetical protein [Actinomycetes]ATY17070.1 hypothetical protein CU254_41535 [Amycolatopsis sp. AA4]EFL12434.1 predicted protein [Streptomyces sp. AA4]